MVNNPIDQAIEEHQDNGATTVSLVQTDDVLLDSLRQLLENDGYKVFFANSGEAALSACRQQPGIIGFLIADLALGHLSGFDLAVELARVHPHLTVVFTATAPTALQASKCDICRMASGHFLPRPFTYSQLRDRIIQLSSGAGHVTLQWLLHSYHEVKKAWSSGRPESPQESREIVPLWQLEKEAIISALAALNGDKAGAAKKLGIGKTTLYRKLRRYEISTVVGVPLQE